MSQYSAENDGLAGALSGLIFLVVAAIIAVAVLAWSPWTNDDGVVGPGQHGADAPGFRLTPSVGAHPPVGTTQQVLGTPSPVITPVLQR